MRAMISMQKRMALLQLQLQLSTAMDTVGKMMMTAVSWTQVTMTMTIATTQATIALMMTMMTTRLPLQAPMQALQLALAWVWAETRSLLDCLAEADQLLARREPQRPAIRGAPPMQLRQQWRA